MSRLDRSELDAIIEREFLAVPLRASTMTFYTPRTSILRSVKKETASFYGSVLDVGCGLMPYRRIIESLDAVEKYVGMDLEKPTYYGNVEPDLKWDGISIPTEDETFDCAMATEFLEHYPEPETVLAEVRRVMKPGGRFFATVPFIWNLHEVPYDEYRYTPYSLERHLRNAGFKDVVVKPLGGWNMALAQMVGLWLGFAPMGHTRRRIFRNLLFPFYAILVRTDRRFERFDGGLCSMYSGLSIGARPA